MFKRIFFWDIYFTNFFTTRQGNSSRIEMKGKETDNASSKQWKGRSVVI